MVDSGKRTILIGLGLALVAGAVLRGVWLTADPPSHATVGIVWHDEGAWVHNARNRALFGVWKTDEWNPVFVAPVFTLLEYGAFRAFGVGTWQARTVPAASGLLAVGLLALGLRTIAGRRAATIGAWLLATNYVFVMWNRAALMESTMTAFIVASWAAYAVAERRPAWGVVAAIGAILAWFTKASAAFYLLALVLDASVTLALSGWGRLRRRLQVDRPAVAASRGAWWTLAGLGIAGVLALLLFVVPYWQEYRFYNWQMSVARKPTYSLGAFLDRASWIPIVHDFFTRMWLVTLTAAIGILAVVRRWRTARPSERLLVLWVLVGLFELVIHDSGNERRYVMFVPALIGLCAIVLSPPPSEAAADPPDRWTRFVMLAVLLGLCYLVVGSVVRLAFLYEVRPGVRLSAGLAVAVWLAIAWRWTRIQAWFARQRPSAAGVALIAALVVAGDLAQFVQWSLNRTTLNYEASKAVGRLLPDGTLVHGKLANGLSLENRIHPVFVGRGFGNYADRTQRDDIRYILTYILPRVGYEGSVITDVLEAYPRREVIATFPVAETNGGSDRAALIDKFGSGRAGER